MTTDSEKLELAKKFLTGLRNADFALHESIMVKEIVWSMPGENLISGDAKGAEAIHQWAQIIKAHGMNFELKNILIGRYGATALLHNTAQHNGKMFDMLLTTVMAIRDGKTVALDTYIADIMMLNTFFAAP